MFISTLGPGQQQFSESVQKAVLEFLRTNSYLSFKQPREVRRVFETEPVGDFGYALISCNKDVLCLRHQVKVNQLQSGFAGFLLQQIAQILRREVQLRRQVSN